MNPGLMLLLGIGGLILGLLMLAGWFDWILRVGGIILIVIGVLGILAGGAKLFGGKSSSMDRF